MMSVFSNFRNEKNLVLQGLRCTAGSRQALYAAVPITTGRRLWQLGCKLRIRDLDAIATSYPQLYHREVLKPNLKAASKFVSELRERGDIVIDPSELKVKGWTQRNYGLLWTEVIVNLVASVALSSEWVYSRGSVAECVVALKRNIPLTDVKGNKLSASFIRQEIQRAKTTARECGIYAKYLIDAERNLHSIGDAHRRARAQR